MSPEQEERAAYEALKDTQLGRVVRVLSERGFRAASIREVVRFKGGTPWLCRRVEGMARYLETLQEGC